MFHGLVRWDEVRAGAISHAIRFTGQQTDQSFLCRRVTRRTPPPTRCCRQARFQLKATYDISHFSSQTRVILRAIQRYGLILADNGSNWFFSGTQDPPSRTAC